MASPVNGNNSDADAFPCKLTINVPFPTADLASIVLQVLQVDEELSPLVRRSFSVACSMTTTTTGQPLHNILQTDYSATTNRMLRVAINGFFESLGVVLSTLRELDIDVVDRAWIGDGIDDPNAETACAKEEDVRDLKRVQGVGEVGPL